MFTIEAFFAIAFGVLALNLLVALVVIAARKRSWILLLLLSGTAGAAMVAVLGQLTDPPMSRYADIVALFTGLAVFSAVIAVVAYRRRLDRPIQFASGDD
ncbi:hypothetical protein [Corynebacterium sputi]|uniref:hypothetical protein n=1 Tax=Corynebacterium sputi TaxID=489915 RepID=UPI000416457F|nr:hypothetical protein [Corynebacterium sputi]